MFPLGGGEFPKDKQTLQAALISGVAALGIAPWAVSIDGEFPSFAAIRMDLTRAKFHRGHRPVAALPGGKHGFYSRVVEVYSEPAFFEGLPFQCRLHAEDCVLAFRETADGMRAAALQSCSMGSFEAAATVADVESALRKVVEALATKQGATLQSFSLTIKLESHRCLSFSSVAVAKAMVFSATLTVKGRTRITDDFKVQFSDLECSGDGMIANLAAGSLRPRLAKLEKRRFPVSQILPEGCVLTGIEFETTSPLKIKASFLSTSQPK